jgi:hypothetical protein
MAATIWRLILFELFQRILSAFKVLHFRRQASPVPTLQGAYRSVNRTCLDYFLAFRAVFHSVKSRVLSKAAPVYFLMGN